jgi:hypothetical protein
MESLIADRAAGQPGMKKSLRRLKGEGMLIR